MDLLNRLSITVILVSLVIVMVMQTYHSCLHIVERFVHSQTKGFPPRLDTILIAGAGEPGRTVAQERNILHKQRSGEEYLR